MPGKHLARQNGPSRFDFGPLAQSYEDWYREPAGAMYDKIEKRAVGRLLPRGRGEKLLEIGCGTGHWSAWFAERGYRVVGIDVSEAMVRAARNKSIAGAAFLIGDASALPFGEGVFDVAAAITALEFVGDAGAAVREAVRCLKRPGGRLLVGTLNVLSPLNRRRVESGKQPYASANFFSPSELGKLLSPFGRAKIKVVGFVPRRGALLRIAPLLDALGRTLRLPWGDFIVAEVLL